MPGCHRIYSGHTLFVCRRDQVSATSSPAVRVRTRAGPVMLMRKTLWLCALMAAALPPVADVSSAQSRRAPLPESSVEVTGAQHFSQREIRGWMLSSDGLLRVAREYGAAGYWWAEVTETTDSTASGVARRVTVSEGPRARLAVHFSRDGSPADTVSMNDPSDVGPWALGVLRRQAERGHPFCSMRFEGASEPGPGRAMLNAVLSPGPEVRVGGVRSLGNTITRESVVRRELRQAEGSLYSQRNAERWRRRLLRTGYFSYVGEPGLAWRDSLSGAADLVIEVAEGSPNRFDGVVGYQPGTAGEKGTFTGLVDLLLGNLWGTGRRLSARWQRPEEETTTLDVSYTEPWIGGIPLDVQVGLAIEQRLGYALEEFTGEVYSEVLPDLILSAGIGREKARSDSVLLLGGPRHEGLLLSLGGSYDTRDDAQNPRSGVLYEAAWRTTSRTNRIADEDFVYWFGEGGWPRKERVTSFSADLEHYIRLRGALSLALGLHGQQISGEGEIASADLLRLGGALDLRGYTQDQFAGDRILWSNTELRYHIGTASRAFVFVDVGSVRTPAAADDTTEEPGARTITRAGYGLGLRAQTRAGLLGVDFAWGKGDSFGQGKVHVRLETEF